MPSPRSGVCVSHVQTMRQGPTLQISTLSLRSFKIPRQIALVTLVVAVLALAVAEFEAVRRWKPDRPDNTAAQAVVDVSRIHYQVSPTHPRILLNDAPTLSRLQQRLQRNTAAAGRFRELVDAQVSGADDYGFEPWFAALMFRVTGDRQYATYAISRTDAAVSSEEALIGQDRPATVAEDSYLHVGSTIGNLSIVYDWCYDMLTPAQRSRWLTYANQSVWNVWHPAQAQWGAKRYAWTGWSVDNPSNNYYYSFLRATMLLGLASKGESDQAQTWLDTFRVDKLESQLFPTFDRDLEGGGSREGTGYGTAMRSLFLLFDWWERSTGERLAERTPHTLASMAHLMHSTAPTLDRLAPTGDHARDSTAALFDYHRDYLLELIALFPREQLSGVARTYLEASSTTSMRHGFNAYSDFLYGDPDVKARPLEDLATTYRGIGTGQLMMRSSWSKDATFANFVCGPYTESHAHRDQGSFVLYKNAWLANDANMQSHSGIERDEEFHNLVRFQTAGAPVKQRNGPGCTLRALTDNAVFTYADADVMPAYRGASAIRENSRELLFLKPGTFVVVDRAVAAPGTQRIWTMNVPKTPEIVGNRVHVGEGSSSMDIERLKPLGLSTSLIRWADTGRDASSGYRLDTVDIGLANEPFLNVISLGGAVSNALSLPDAGGLSASIALADGRRAVVRFATDASAGSLLLTARDGTPIYDGPLTTGVARLPMFARRGPQER